MEFLSFEFEIWKDFETLETLETWNLSLELVSEIDASAISLHKLFLRIAEQDTSKDIITHENV